MKIVLKFLLLSIFLLVSYGATAAEINIDTDTLSLRFSERGSLLSVTVCFPLCEDSDSRRQYLEHPEGVIGFDQISDQRWVQRQGVIGGQDASVNAIVRQLHFSHPEGQNITWLVPESGYLLEVIHTGNKVSMRSGAGFRPRPAAGFGGWLEQVRYVAISTSGVRQIGLDESTEPPLQAEWGGFRSRFWTLLGSGETESEFEFQGGEANQDAVLTRTSVLSGEKLAFYLGPVEPEQLKSADGILQDMLYAGLWFWLRWICFALFYLLSWVQSLVPSWGLAVMLLSGLVHVLMLPLSRIADHFQQQVAATEVRLAPALSRIKQESQGEEQANRILALYKEEKVHPLYSLKSMLGVAVVIPIFIGAFDMLAENIYLLNTQFLWISDLSRADDLLNLPLNIPFFGSEFNLLPFLMTGLSVTASLLHKPLASNPDLRKQQLRNMFLLAIAFFVLFYTFPAGMVLYWTTNNLIAVLKSGWTRLSATQEQTANASGNE